MPRQRSSQNAGARLHALTRTPPTDGSSYVPICSAQTPPYAHICPSIALLSPQATFDGAVASVIALMRTHLNNPRVLAASARTLFELLRRPDGSGGDETRCAAALYAGAFEVLREALTSMLDAQPEGSVLKFVVLAVLSLTFGSVLRAQQAVDAGVVEALYRLNARLVESGTKSDVRAALDICARWLTMQQELLAAAAPARRARPPETHGWNFSFTQRETQRAMTTGNSEVTVKHASAGSPQPRLPADQSGDQGVVASMLQCFGAWVMPSQNWQAEGSYNDPTASEGDFYAEQAYYDDYYDEHFFEGGSRKFE